MLAIQFGEILKIKTNRSCENGHEYCYKDIFQLIFQKKKFKNLFLETQKRITTLTLESN